MRLPLLVASAVIPLASALADTRVATRPGTMCLSASALARLTRPDGSSRAAGPGARPDAMRIAADGHCIPIHPGIALTVLQTRRRTSIVQFDAKDGRGLQTYVAPNIDLTADAAGGGVPGRKPAWPDRDYSPLRDAFRLLAVVQARCPQQGWDEHRLSHTEAGPWDVVFDRLSASQRAAIGREQGAQCRIGLSCPADIAFGMEVEMGHGEELVRLICSTKAEVPD